MSYPSTQPPAAIYATTADIDPRAPFEPRFWSGFPHLRQGDQVAVEANNFNARLTFSDLPTDWQPPPVLAIGVPRLGRYGEADAPLLEKMDALIAKNDVFSVLGAARQVAPEGVGASTPSIEERLRKKFATWRLLAENPQQSPTSPSL